MPPSHVLAAAVRAGAAVIVTWNLTDFQSEALAPYDIDLQTPDVFLCHLWHLNPGLMAYILREQAAFLKDPPTTLNQLLDTLAKHVPTLVTTARTSGLL